MNDNREVNLGVTEEIDLVDFSANQEMDRIRENERIEREKRMKRANQLRRAEIIRKRKIERIKQTVTAWAILILGIIVVVALISGVISIFDKDEPVVVQEVGDKVSEKETALVEAFRNSDSAVYGTGKAASLNNMVNEFSVIPSSGEDFVTLTSEYAILSDAYAWNDSLGAREMMKDKLRAVPMFSNGYIWSSEKSMKTPITGDGYLYDTNAAFINAVYNVCLWDGDVSFLSELDTVSEAKGDISGGLTVLEKLEKATKYYFNDKDPNGGGIRYGFKYVVKNGILDIEKTDDGLVYISTADNLGTPKGKASNIFPTYKFGYLDCYSNLTFYQAMDSLSKLYAMMENTAESERYAAIAVKSKEAINSTFYDSEKGRYIGYIDADGTKYDSGFVAINLLAIKLGVADEAKVKSIKSWIGGETKVSGDDLDSKSISSGVLTAFSTVSANDSTWDNIGGKYLLSGSSAFGSCWLNGGNSALATAWLMDVNEKQSASQVLSSVTKLSDAFSTGNLVLGEDETAEPHLYYALLASKTVKQFFGVSINDNVLCVNPVSSSDMGIKGIAYARKYYDVLYNKGDAYIFCNVNAPVKMRIGGFEKDAPVKVSIIDSELISQSEETKADKNGFVTISKKFGNTSYIKIEA